MYEVGSVVDFWPDPGGAMNGVRSGVGLFVTARDGWVMTTELRRTQWDEATGRFSVIHGVADEIDSGGAA